MTSWESRKNALFYSKQYKRTSQEKYYLDLTKNGLIRPKTAMNYPAASGGESDPSELSEARGK
jgi:hypothetical protein